MRLVAALCLTGAVWFGYLLGRRIPPAVGALTAVGIACYPLVIYTAQRRQGPMAEDKVDTP